MRIYVATRADIPEMHRVRTSVHENQLSDPTRVQPQHYESLLDKDGRAWVAEVDGRIVGFAVAHVARANVWALFVEPGFEGRGIGRKLHDNMMAWFFTAGAELVWLSTEPGTRAEAFYIAAGWRYARDQRNGEVRYEMARQEWLRQLG